MFCKKCGAKIADDSSFCAKCGANISDTALSITSVDSVRENSPTIRNTAISDSFENVSVMNTYYDRVDCERFDTTEKNNMLFSVFNKVLDPIRNIENLTNDIGKLTERASYLRNRSNASSNLFYPFIFVGAVLHIIVFIIFAIKDVDLSTAVFLSPALVFFDQSGGTSSILLDLICMFIVAPILDIAKSGLLFALIPFLIDKLALTPSTYKKNLEEAEKLDGEIIQKINEREAICNKIKDEIVYVPRKYRYSEAIGYFCDLYDSSRVSTLKEAINVFENDKMEKEKIAKLESLNMNLENFFASLNIE